MVPRSSLESKPLTTRGPRDDYEPVFSESDLEENGLHICL
jgi:hypothetical protein